MGFLLILPILVSGFTVCHTHPYFKYKLHRYEGQYLYLQTAKLGFYCFGIAVLIQSFLLWVCNINLNLPLFSETPSYLVLLENWLKQHHFIEPEKAYSAAYLVALSFFMMFLSPHVFSFLFRIWFYFKRDVWNTEIINLIILVDLLEDSPLDKALMSGILEDKLMMLDMDDRKVYVCKISTMGEPNENQGADQEIAILPIVSGYRDKDTLKVNLNTEYSSLKISSTLVLKQEKIIAIREFDFEIWDQFNSEKKQIKEPPLENVHT